MATGGERPATVADVHKLAAAMPNVTRSDGPKGNPVYAVGGKSFVFFRTPRPDAADPATGERYDDVIMFWVESEEDKHALVSDADSPFFTTPHFDGHPSVLIRAAHLGDLSYGELAEVVQDAWLSRASAARAARWLREHDLRLPRLTSRTSAALSLGLAPTPTPAASSAARLAAAVPPETGHDRPRVTRRASFAGPALPDQEIPSLAPHNYLR